MKIKAINLWKDHLNYEYKIKKILIFKFQNKLQAIY
jgi:hypothetical protein